MKVFPFPGSTKSSSRALGCDSVRRHWEFGLRPQEVTTTPSSQGITQLLQAWSDGDERALARLTPLVSAELHRLAHRYMAGERPGHMLQTTALINEAYVRLMSWKKVSWRNRAHFFAVSAKLMRHILVDFARRRPRLERGGEARQLLFIEEFPYVFITVIRDAKRAISHIEGSCGLWSSTEQSEQMW